MSNNECTGGKFRKEHGEATIEVSAEELEKAIQGAYLKQKNKISVPGFRKGKFRVR